MNITCIISSHNYAQYLSRSIRSAASQSHPPVEIIVLEDASEDNSVAVVESLQRTIPFLKLVRYPEKSPDWMKSMMEQTKPIQADYIHFLAADDWIRPDFYAACAGSVPNGLIIANVEVTDQHGHFLMHSSRFDLPPGSHFRTEGLRQWLLSPILPGGTACILRHDACQWLIDNNADRLGPWFDSIGYPAAMWPFGLSYIPEVYGVFRYDHESGYGGGNRPVERRLQEKPNAEAFFAQPGVKASLPEDIREALCRKVA